MVEESERLRIELLERLFEATQTFVELTELDMKVGNGPHLADGIRQVEQSLDLGSAFQLSEPLPQKG